MKKLNLIKFALCFFLITSIFSITVLAKAYYDNFVDGILINKPLYNIKSDTLKTDKEVYSKDDSILAWWDMCKGTNDVAEISIVFYDAIQTPMTPIISNKAIGCYAGWDTIVITIPKNMLPDTYYIKANVRYHVNDAADVEYIFFTNKFIIK